MKLKSLITNGILAAVSIAVTAGAIEYGTRVLYPALVPSGQLRFVAGSGDMPALGPRDAEFRQIKNTGDFDVAVRFNKYGFRDSKDIAKSSPDDYFVVGDSLSFGWGVEEDERYSNRLQAALGRDVYNLSVPGDMDDFEKVLAYAKRNGANIKRLILGISMALNLRDYDNPAPPTASASRSPGFVRAVKSYLMTHSAFYFLVTSFIHKSESLKTIAVDLGLITPTREGIAYKPYSRHNIESTARRAARFATGYDLTVVLVPSRALWFGTDKEKKTADRIHREMTAHMKELGLDVVDVRSDFEAAGDPAKNYFVNDGHWSPAGHAAAARAIARHLKARGKAN